VWRLQAWFVATSQVRRHASAFDERAAFWQGAEVG
jgi:hypothetical protein